MHRYNPPVYTESLSLKFCTLMIKKKEANQRDYANLNETKVATCADTVNKIWPGRVSIIVLEWNVICFIYWQNFNGLNSGTKYTLSKFQDEIRGCYPEEPSQAGEMGWQEPRALQGRQCEVLHLGSSPLPAPGPAGGQQAALCKRTWRSWWATNRTWVRDALLLWHRLSCVSKSVASRLTGVIISPSSTLMRLVLESKFEPASTRKALNKCCECSGGPAKELVGWSTGQARRSGACWICSVSRRG